MKKLQKLLLSVFLSISLMFGCSAFSMPVYAVGNVWDSAQSYAYFENHFEEINTRLNGVIINQNELRESFEHFLDEYRDTYNIPSGTTTTTWIGDNISGTYQNGSVGVSDLDFSQTFRQAMRDWCNAYIEANTGFYYAYTWNTADYSHYFNDQNQFHAFINFIDTNNTDYHCLYSTFNNQFILVPNDFFNSLVYERFVSGESFYDTTIYKDWVRPSDTVFPRYSYDNNSQSFIDSGQTDSYPGFTYFPLLSDIAVSGSTNNMNWHEVNVNRKTYQVYKTYNSMQNGTEGIQDYYVTDSYNSSISGSYNTTTSNIENTINSNNVNNYINSYYIENSEYPTPNQISIYINNYDGSGNGSGGSGESGDNDDDNNFNWGFLGTIGDFLGGLLSGISGVISGLLEGITGIIDLFIGSENAETGQREGGLPSIIGQLLNYFLPFLPSEILTLIELSIVLALIIGVVKLIRGS